LTQHSICVKIYVDDLSETFGGENLVKQDNSGKITGFTMSETELAEKIENYKKRVDAGLVELPFWTDFREYLGVRQDVLDAVMQRGYFDEGAKDSAYYNRCLMLKSMGETCENYLVTHPNWGGRNAVKSMMLLKQGLGWTKKYIDEKSTKADGPNKISISFGGGDARGRKAAK
jgi:hypothetical protein